MPKVKSADPEMFGVICEILAEVGPPLTHRIFLDDIDAIARAASKRLRVIEPKPGRK
jgi:hypothetical protein